LKAFGLALEVNLLHTLLGVRSQDDLLCHPKRGASWEGIVIRIIIEHLGARPEECFFWGVHTGAELDLLVRRGGDRRGYEVKLTTSPGTTRSMHSAYENLKLKEIVVIHAGSDSYPLTPKIRAVALKRLHEDVEPLED
jgi:predicted AAA+ superfamily ATPase